MDHGPVNRGQTGRFYVQGRWSEMTLKRLMVGFTAAFLFISSGSFETVFFSPQTAEASSLSFLTKLKVGLHHDHIRVVAVLDGPAARSEESVDKGQEVIRLVGVMPSPSLKKDYRINNRSSKKLISEITVVYKPGRRTTFLYLKNSSGLGAAHLFTLDRPSRIVVDYPVTQSGKVSAPSHRKKQSVSRKSPPSSSKVSPSPSVPSQATTPGNHGKVYVIPGQELKEKEKKTGTEPVQESRVIESDYPVPVSSHRFRVVLDAGHGGKDCGTTSVNGYCEKDLVLDIVRRLGSLLENDGRFRVFYTRTDDTFISLKNRTRIANRDHGDLFLSVHANADPDPSVRGIQTYLLTLHSKDKRAMALAKRENASLGAAGDLGAILLTLRINHKKKHSMELATSLDHSLIGTLSSHYSGIRDFGVKHAPFYVIMGTSMPAVLTEVNFLSNRRDAALMAQGSYRQRVAEGLYRGIVSYDRWVHPETVNRLAKAQIHPE